MLLIAIKIWLLGVSFAHILPKELLYLRFIGLVSYLSISTEPKLENMARNLNLTHIQIN